MYHTRRIARVVAEMTRPGVKMSADGTCWGGHCVYSLRFSGLARSFQARFLIHQCTSRYCLLNRNSCRFFFPWPKQPHQLHDENTDRIQSSSICWMMRLGMKANHPIPWMIRFQRPTNTDTISAAITHSQPFPADPTVIIQPSG